MLGDPEATRMSSNGVGAVLTPCGTTALDRTRWSVNAMDGIMRSSAPSRNRLRRLGIRDARSGSVAHFTECAIARASDYSVGIRSTRCAGPRLCRGVISRDAEVIAGTQFIEQEDFVFDPAALSVLAKRNALDRLRLPWPAGLLRSGVRRTPPPSCSAEAGNAEYVHVRGRSTSDLARRCSRSDGAGYRRARACGQATGAVRIENGRKQLPIPICQTPRWHSNLLVHGA